MRFTNRKKLTVSLINKITRKITAISIQVFRNTLLQFKGVKKHNAIIIAYTAIYKQDAIGYDTIKQYEMLRKKKYNVYLYSEQFDNNLFNEIITKKQLFALIKEKNTILVLHFGNFWAGLMEMLDVANCKIIIKYHNITPPIYFYGYDDVLVKNTQFGYDQLGRVIKSGKVGLYLVDSYYNGREIEKMGMPKETIKTVPPFHKIELFKKEGINDKLAKQLQGRGINIIFVGRVAPNKGHKHLIETMRAYVNIYNSREICLHIIGDIALPLYYDELVALVSRYGIYDVVKFTGSVNMKDLHTYYACADVFLLMSEHEGFCVPILEAQYYKVPVVCLDRAAVGSTLGDGQCIHKELDYPVFAKSLYEVTYNEGYRNKLINSGQANLQRYSDERISTLFLQSINSGFNIE